ncbi:MAG: PEGA domain-containing protein [Deltaproteobacteria bacterium]|nr:PEGA domain-containing protein [Deltaproteobacteria bacterium]
MRNESPAQTCIDRRNRRPGDKDGSAQSILRAFILLYFQRKIRPFLLVTIALFAFLVGTGCAHKTIVRTEPEGAFVKVDGTVMGNAPVVVERMSGTGGKMRIQASADGFQDTMLDVTRAEWFFWPALLALTPAIGLPLFFVVPPAGPLIAIGWACLTLPTAISLLFIQKYPDEVVVKLSPRVLPGDTDFLPTDDWTVPDEYSPNPLPFPTDSSPKKEERQPLPTPPLERSPSPLPENLDGETSEEPGPLGSNEQTTRTSTTTTANAGSAARAKRLTTEATFRF